jgi:N-acetylmuramoyl-L-alanine amidase
MTSIVISSGHGQYIRGASGYLDEVDEARKVVETIADYLRDGGVEVKTFHDNTSHDQSTNLNTIVNYHNAQTRDLDISVHFNAYQTTSSPMGTEVLWCSQEQLAGDVSEAIANAGDLVNRGPKYRSDLFFLNNTEEPAILIETCFVDSSADASMYRDNYDAICAAIANVIAPNTGQPPDRPERPPVDRPKPPPSSGTAHVDITIATTGDVVVTVNGKPIAAATS